MTDPEMTQLEFNRRLGAWIGQWAEGGVNDQNSLYLKKLIDQRVEEQVKKKGGDGSIPPEKKGQIVTRWARALVNQAAWASEPPYTAAADAIHTAFTSEVHEDAPPTPLPPDPTAEAQQRDAAARDGYTAAMARSLEETAADRDKLQSELARAHDWRFHLESRAREAFQALREMAGQPTAPTKGAFTAVMQTLREGIDWAP